MQVVPLLHGRTESELTRGRLVHAAGVQMAAGVIAGGTPELRDPVRGRRLARGERARLLLAKRLEVRGRLLLRHVDAHLDSELADDDRELLPVQLLKEL